MRADRIQGASVTTLALLGERLERLIFYSNRGTQSASAQIAAYARPHRTTWSMG